MSDLTPAQKAMDSIRYMCNIIDKEEDVVALLARFEQEIREDQDSKTRKGVYSDIGKVMSFKYV